MPRITRASNVGNMTLICRPEAAPLPSITWFKNGVELSTSLTNMEQGVHGQLTVVGVNKGDEGTYVCKAVNALGEAEDRTTVQVIGMCVCGCGCMCMFQ